MAKFEKAVMVATVVDAKREIHGRPIENCPWLNLREGILKNKTNSLQRSSKRSHPLVLPAPCRDRRNRGARSLRHLRRTGISLLGSLRRHQLYGNAPHLLPGLRPLLPGRTLSPAWRPARPLHAAARLRLRLPPAATPAARASASPARCLNLHQIVAETIQ